MSGMTHWLLERLGESEDLPAMIWRDRPYSYRQLLDQIAHWQKELDARNVQPGEVVAVDGDYSPDACALLLALIANRNIAVPLTSSAANKKAAFLEIARVGASFEFGLDDTRRFYRGEVTADHPLLRQLREQGDPGLVLFSSGSTGESKAALHNFSKVLDKFKKRRHQMRTIPFLLLDHIGGINTLFYTLSSGGTVVPIDERTPQAICRAIERHRVQLLPTSPTFLNLLLISEAYKEYDLSSLELITYGTEVMPASTLQRLTEILPAVQLKQTYGLSELGILRSQSRDSSSLWVRVGGEGYETKVVDGILWIRAESAMLGYLNAPSPFDDAGWFNTEDVVEVDGEYLRILGRSSEIINVGGEKVYPSEVESTLLEMANIQDVTVRGQPNLITGNVVLATVTLFEPEDPRALKKRVQEFCRGRLARYKIPAVVQVGLEAQFGDRFKKMRNVPPSTVE